MEKPTIELATRGDIDQIVALRQTCMPHVTTTKELIEWQFFDHPAGPAKIYVIRSQEGIVSMYTAVQQHVRIQGEVRKARMVQDVMTLPAYRGRGYLHQQGFRCWQDMTDAAEFGYTFPNQHSENSFRRTGWTELSRVPLRTAQITPSSHKPYNHAYQAIDTFDERATRVWDRCSFAVGVHRDAAYLNWRYSKPDCNYNCFMIDDTEGVLVLKVFSDGSKRTVHICELFVAGSHQSLLVEDTLKFSRSFAQNARADSLTCWLPQQHKDESPYLAFGFKNPTLERFVFFKPAVETDRVLSEKHWHFSQGDSDVF